MSEDLVDEPFRSAAKRVDETYDRAGEELRAKVAKAKTEALKKIRR